MKKLYIMRHGETEWNREKRYQGQLDSPLSSIGVNRTEMQKTKLENIQFSNVYCSPLGRTKSTLDILTPLADRIHFDERLKEISLGALQGKVNAELSESEKKAHENFWYDPGSFDVEGGETMEQLEIRVKDFLEELPADDGAPDLVITHTVIIKMMLKILESRHISSLWDEPFLHPATVLVLEPGRENPVREVIYPEDDMEIPDSYTA